MIFSRLAIKQLFFLLLLSKIAAAKTALRHHEQHKYFKDDQQAGGDLASLDRVDGDSQTKSGQFASSMTTNNNLPKSGGLRKAQKNNMRILSVTSSVCESFAVHARAAITFAASNKISGGDVGISPGTSITGAYDLVDGALLANAADSARFAASVYDDWVAAMEIREDATAFDVEMGGKTFTRGIWHSGTITILAGSIVTLDGGHDTSSEFLFQSGTLVAGAGAKIVLINGAKAENVLWAFGTSVVFGAGFDFEGSIIAGTSITFGADNHVQGCVVALTAITFGAGNSVTVAQEPPLPPELQKKLETFSPDKQAKILAKFAEINLNPIADGEYVNIDDQGDVMFVDPPPPEGSPNDDGGNSIQQYPDATDFEDSGVPIYHSKPGAKYTLYLDFDGHAWSGHAWARGASIDALPYDTDGNPDVYSADELSVIGNSWAIVAEDFAPFDIDVTTQEPAVLNDDVGHVLMTDKMDKNGVAIFNCGCGGVAYVGVFGRNKYASYYSPALVYNKSLKGLSEAISHEFGHNLGLSHDGSSSRSYYTGHGTGDTDWAPIMGVGYYANVVQWSKGEYSGATQTQDDLAIIASKLGYSADDHPTATPLAVTGTDGFGEGLIERSTDKDSWTFEATGGSITVTVSTGTGRYSNLDAGFVLVNMDTDATLATVQPEGQRSATWTGVVNNAKYAVVVFSTGNGADADVGYTSYGSLGKYTVAVHFHAPPPPPSANAQPSDAPSVEPAENPTSEPTPISKPANCNGVQACLNIRDTTIGDGSCNGGSACRQLVGTTVGDGSCLDTQACCYSKMTSIGENSCTYAYSCLESFNSIIGSDSCYGHSACDSIRNVSIGSGSCLGDHACRSMRVNVGDRSCTYPGSCSCREYKSGDDIPDDTCNAVGECCPT
jgi:hypothetical protein